ncbi:MAG: hypothetical protein KGL64_09030 [Acidobacteriota bacterium]|nr:hypothetical protein [Acidobacteriota bacterium]
MKPALPRKHWPAAALLLALSIAACHKEEQAVEGVAQKAATAEQKAQATATLRDKQRAALAAIPLPTKSLYVDIHDPSGWENPFLTVEADKIDLRILLTDANTSSMGQGTLLRPEAARRQEMQIRLADLAEAVTALPPEAWRYGRVVAVAEAPAAPAKDRPQIRRNVEAAIQQLNDLGVVVEEWPGR